MNSYLRTGLVFVSGIVIGAFSMKKYIEYKNDQEYYEIEEDDTEAIEEYDVSQDLDSAFKEEQKVPSTPTSRIDYSKIRTVEDKVYTDLLDDLKYKVDKEAEENSEDIPDYIEVEEIDHSKPYYIDQEEFEALDDYESDEYTVYADGYITDSYGLPISDEDVENVMGLDFMRYFDKYDKDQIWIRNERLSLDVSIIRDLDKFVDIAPPRIKRMAGL